MESILTSIKKLCGITAEDTAFDTDIITHINSVFMDLTEMGVGPTIGFYIEDDTAVWTDFVRTVGRIEAIKSYIYLRVKLLFDPPSNSALIESINKQIVKFEWMINHVAEFGESEDAIRYAEYEAEIVKLRAEIESAQKELSEATTEYDNFIAQLETMIEDSGMIGDDVVAKINGLASTQKWLQAYQVNYSNTNYPKFAYGNVVMAYAPFVDLSKLTDLRSVFFNCQSLRSMPIYDCSSMTTADSFCYKCISLVEFPKMKGFCKGSKNTSLRNTFYDCKVLRTIGELDCTNVTTFYRTFYNCNALENISFVPESIHISLEIPSPILTPESVENIVKGLAFVAEAQTLTLSTDAFTHLTDTHWEIAGEQNWFIE